MTADEVVAASKGRAQTMSPEEIRGKSFYNELCLLKQTYQAGDLELDAMFCFSQTSNRLVRVSITPSGGNYAQCQLVKDELGKKYGAPQSDTADSVSHQVTWRDQQATTEILFYKSRLDGCSHVNYDAVSTEESQGL